MKLYEIVKQNGILVQDFAKAMGVSFRSVYYYGDKSITTRTLYRMCAAFKKLGVDYTPTELLSALTK